MRGDAEDSTTAEQERTIEELREEVRIVQSRFENNPDVKRYAGALAVQAGSYIVLWAGLSTSCLGTVK